MLRFRKLLVTVSLFVLLLHVNIYTFHAYKYMQTATSHEPPCREYGNGKVQNTTHISRSWQFSVIIRTNKLVLNRACDGVDIDQTRAEKMSTLIRKAVSLSALGGSKRPSGNLQNFRDLDRILLCSKSPTLRA